MSQLIVISQNAVFAIVVLAFIYISKFIDDRRTTEMDDDKEIIDRHNLAVGIRRTGLFLAMAFGMTGPLISGKSTGFLSDIKLLVIDGILALMMLFAARWITQKAILRNINGDSEIKSGNTAVGIVEGSIFIATGLILHGSFSGEGEMISSIVFFILGQVALIILFIIYEKLSKFALLKEINSGNPAAALAVAGVLISLGIILRSSVSGNFTGWAGDIISFFVSAACGIALLLVVSKVCVRLFLPGGNLDREITQDRNISALLVAQAVIIAFSLVLSAVI